MVIWGLLKFQEFVPIILELLILILQVVQVRTHHEDSLLTGMSFSSTDQSSFCCLELFTVLVDIMPMSRELSWKCDGKSVCRH